MEKEEISISEIIAKINDIKKYLFSNWKIILFSLCFGAILGLTVSILKPKKYKAELTFIIEEETSSASGGLSSLASNFGLGGIGGSGGLFTTTNMLEFLKSRNLIEKTLLSKFNNSKLTFAEKYIIDNEIDKELEEDEWLKNIHFLTDESRGKFSIQKDSILGSIYQKIVENELKVIQPNEDNSILKIELISKNEIFSKLFIEELLKIVSFDYTISKTKKAKNNVNIIQKQVDSVRTALYNSISGAAVANDNVFGLNPAMNIQRVPSAKKQVDVQANSVILAELVKNLELSKMTLMNQTPLVQIIDTPILPLEEIKLRKAVGVLIGGFLSLFIIISFLLLKRFIKKIKQA